MTDTLYYHAREVPADWRAALRELDPIRDATSYLDFVWHVPSQRWVLYNFVPMFAYPPEDQRTFWQEVNGPDPRTLEAGDTFLSHVQWQLWQTHKRIAEPYWVLQGRNGGHLVRYNSLQQNIAKASGLANHPPAPGDLPYAGWDHKAAHQIRTGNLLVQAGMDLDRFMRDTSGDGLRRKKADAAKAYRTQMAKWLADSQADAIDHYVRALKKDEIPVTGDSTAPDWERIEEKAVANYIETGSSSGWSDVKTV